MFTLLKKRGFKVEFKLGFWQRKNTSPQFAMMEYVPKDANGWFKNCHAELVHYAKLLQESDVDIFDISYEHSHLVYQYAPQWKDLISAVREVYHGQITANFQNIREAQNATFLNSLDLTETSVFYKYVSSDFADGIRFGKWLGRQNQHSKVEPRCG